MASVVLGVAGAAVGFAFGGVAGAQAGWMIGSTIGGVMDAPKGQHIEGQKLADLRVQVSTYGKAMPQVFGKMRVSGNVIWAAPLIQTAHTQAVQGGGKGGGGGATQTTYTYSANFAVSLVNHQIDAIYRIWADGLLIYNSAAGDTTTISVSGGTAGQAAITGSITTYLGTETQMPDALMESYIGAGSVPAYRGQAYVVFNNLQLAHFGNRLPNIEVEIVREPKNTSDFRNKIKAIHIIPGAGEACYNTTRLTKVMQNAAALFQGTGVITTITRNSNTVEPRADVLVALDQLQATCPNLQWVSLVACWFGDSTDAGLCTIKPRVDFPQAIGAIDFQENFDAATAANLNAAQTATANTTPNLYAWSVGTWTRANTPVAALVNGVPAYGGSPSDLSVIELATELKRRGLKVMFYPLIFMETPTKPWRGRIVPANATDAANWFTKPNGYNAFITHYSTLTALTSQIDAFVVGSEYVGMTSFMSAPGVFPAVTGFANLAATVRAQLPANVKTVYAADWSEYHHATGGWFNMDELFANVNLDIVGIDNYMPVTPDLDQSQITPALVQQYWAKGEGWDYYWDNSTFPRFCYLPANPITTTAGSAAVTINMAGFNTLPLAGDSVTLAGLIDTGGIVAANLNGSFIVQASGAGVITVTAPVVATATATGGGTAGTINKPKYFTGTAYAWKNVAAWWTSTHTNPNGALTAWTPKMKPLWFTEFGFPSVDGSANQCNVFVDPTSSESGYPRASKQMIDFRAQDEAIGATIDFWDAQTAQPGMANFVANKILWTWDARPHPYYPNLLPVWADGSLWATGHWIEGKGAKGVGSLVGNLCAQVGMTNIDVSQLTDRVDGYAITQQTTARAAIEPLMRAYYFDAVESDGVLKFVKRGAAVPVTIPEDDLAAHLPQPSAQIPPSVEVTRMQDLDLPKIVNVSHFDLAMAYQVGAQHAVKQTATGRSTLDINLPLALTAAKAKEVAEVALHTQWQHRTTTKFATSRKWAHLDPTDVVLVSKASGASYRLLITKRTERAGGIMDYEAFTEDATAYAPRVTPGVVLTAPASGQLFAIGNTRAELLDMPIIRDADDDAGFYMVGGSATGDPNWQGAVLLKSIDGGSTYQTAAAMSVPSGALGTAQTILGAFAGGNMLDEMNTLDVLLTSGTLSSTSMPLLLNGANFAKVGNELIQFRTATLTALNRYTLSGLLRGRFGTEQHIGTHAAAETFCVIDALTAQRIPAGVAEAGLARIYKPVTMGQIASGVTAKTFTNSAAGLRPLSPVLIGGGRDAAGNLTIQWTRRTRVGGAWRDYVDAALGEAVESYSIDIYNGAAIVRTLTSAVPSVTYTAAQQVADFGVTQAAVSVRIYQISATMNRGFAGIATV